MGRPRSAEAEAAIVSATLDLLAESGFAGLSVEAVAGRAGVGKATIYRRWPGKAELVADAVSALGAVADETVGGDVRTDLVTLLEGVRRKFQSSLQGRLFARLLGEARADCEFWAAYRERVVRPGRARLAAVVRRGIGSGELRADLDVDLAVDQLIGPLVYRLVARADSAETTTADVERLVDGAMDGLAAH